MFPAEQQKAISELIVATHLIVNKYCSDAEIDGPPAYAVVHDRTRNHPNRNVLVSAAKAPLRVDEINKKALIQQAGNVVDLAGGYSS